MKTTGDILIEGTVEGDIRAHMLTVGETATVKGEVVADDVVVNGRIIGRLRGLKVRLTATARVEGDIIHKTIAIESGAHFEGSVQRQEDPLERHQAARIRSRPAGHDLGTGRTAAKPAAAARQPPAHAAIQTLPAGGRRKSSAAALVARFIVPPDPGRVRIA